MCFDGGSLSCLAPGAATKQPKTARRKQKVPQKIPDLLPSGGLEEVCAGIRGGRYPVVAPNGRQPLLAKRDHPLGCKPKKSAFLHDEEFSAIILRVSR
jgi:hypothetical protein